MGKFNERLVADGVMLAGEGLQATSKGVRLQFRSGEAAVIDGPFTETKELIAGFWLVQGKSREEVVERFKRAPFDEGTLEIRPIFEAADFGENLPPEVREQERRMRAETQA